MKIYSVLQNKKKIANKCFVRKLCTFVAQLEQFCFNKMEVKRQHDEQQNQISFTHQILLLFYCCRCDYFSLAIFDLTL